MRLQRFAASVGLSIGCCGLLTAGFAPVSAKEAAPDGAKQATAVERAAAVEKDVTQGALRIVGEDAAVVECPLKHTDVQADVSGFISRVKVTQTFINPTKEKIEAVYVFPLPNEAAVDDMTMVVGDRRIVGVIERRDAARQIYEQAIAQGQTAALLEQERPNIFTQSVGNIAPGQQVRIEISYVDVLKYDQGAYEFHFPMVVGPRYNPQKSPGQPEVADAAKINPPVLKPNERTSHDISLTVNLDAGVPIQNLTNANHKVHSIKKGETKARVRLLQEDSIPNKDFVLRYEVVGEKPEMAMLAHTGEYGDGVHVGDGYFMLMIQPKEDERLKKSPPREIVFLVDTSGSMSGQPTETTKAAMEEMLKLCREQDTFQVVTFASSAYKLFEKPVPVNEANMKKALAYSRGFRGSGGTRMLEGVKLAIDQPIDKQRIRIVVMLSDGYIGNEAQIIEHVGKNCGDQIRFWAIGVGSSPNMFLIDGVAKQGGGMGQRLGIKDDTKALCTEVITRIQRAQLAKIKIDWGDLQVSETYPAKIPELWAGRPVIVYGRYRDGGDSKISIRGNVEGEDVSWPLTVSMPAKQAEHDVIAKVWARKKIEDVMHQSYYGGSPAVEEEVTALALRYGLMSQYTSFVAVDEKDAGKPDEFARPPRRMTVPVPLPEGTSYEGFFGGEGLAARDLDVDFAVDAVKIPGGKLNESNGRVAGREQPRKAPAEKLRGLTRNYRSSARTDGVSSTPSGTALGRRRGGGIGGGAGQGGMSLRSSTGGWADNKKRVTGRVPQPNKRPAVNRLFQQHRMHQGVDRPAVIADDVSEERFAFEHARQVQAGNAAGTLQAAQAARKATTDLLEKDDLSAARPTAVRAYLLDVAAGNFGQSNGQIANEALAIIEKIHAQQIQAWTKKRPELKKKLNLVLRDSSLSDAINDIAKAANVKIDLLAGSEQDAAALLQQGEIRVSFLDLRHATVAQALDWLLEPARLSWWVSDQGIQIASERRREGQVAWVYDVSSIALPTAKDFSDVKDAAKRAAAVNKAIDGFLAAIRHDLGFEEEKAVWFAPGWLLIISDSSKHEAAARLLADLTSGDVAPGGEAGKLAEVTRRRAAERQDSLAQRMTARQRLDVARRHNEFGWRLLAAASAGRLDLEALTELQIAWNSKATSDLLAGESSDLALRSLWMVCEAARALPEEAELKQLAGAARKSAGKPARDAVETLRDKPDDATAFTQVLFASLALVDDDDYRAAALAALGSAKTDDLGLTPVRTIVTSLLATRDRMDRDALTQLVPAGVRGDVATTLLAAACHRAGGEVWRSFRMASEDLLGKQPLRGEVVVIINRLASGQLQVARR